MAEVYRDLGWVTEAGDPEVEKSVTWVHFPGLIFWNPVYAGSDEISIPVSTKDLIEAGVGLDSEDGTIFVGAEFDDLEFYNIGDARPRDFTPSVADPELEEAFDKGL